jgi:hypothetical protein
VWFFKTLIDWRNICQLVTAQSDVCECGEVTGPGRGKGGAGRGSLAESPEGNRTSGGGELGEDGSWRECWLSALRANLDERG